MYTVIPSDKIASAFNSLKDNPDGFSLEPFAEQIESSVKIDNADIVRLKKQMTVLYDSTPISYFKSSAWNKVDGDSSVLIYQSLTNLDAKVAFSVNFWAYISLYMRDIVYRRYGYKSWADLNPMHFGMNIPESLLSRLWHRAYLSYDQANDDDHFWLARRGASDYWSSFVLRATYSQSTSLIRALTRFFYDPPGISFRLGDIAAKSQIIRILAPELRKQHAITPFEIMNEEECLKVITHLAEELGIVVSTEKGNGETVD